MKREHHDEPEKTEIRLPDDIWGIVLEQVYLHDVADIDDNILHLYNLRATCYNNMLGVGRVSRQLRIVADSFWRNRFTHKKKPYHPRYINSRILNNLTHLERLDVSYVSDIRDTDLSRMTNLTHLSLGTRACTDKSLTSLTRLRSLKISHQCEVTRQGILTVAHQLSRFQLIYYNNAIIGEDTFRHMSGLTELVLKLGGPVVMGLTNDNLKHLPTSLTSLSLKMFDRVSPVITGDGISHLTGLTSLELRQFDVAGHSKLSLMTNLAHLSLDGCRGACDRVLVGHASTLRTLYLNDPSLSVTEQGIAHCTGLRALNFVKNGFPGASPFARLTNLQALVLYGPITDVSELDPLVGLTCVWLGYYAVMPDDAFRYASRLRNVVLEHDRVYKSVGQDQSFLRALREREVAVSYSISFSAGLKKMKALVCPSTC
jgi:hypothetical protein